jgi:hypothetical protein
MGIAVEHKIEELSKKSLKYVLISSANAKIFKKIKPKKLKIEYQKLVLG